jgi:hypothetical protein
MAVERDVALGNAPFLHAHVGRALCQREMVFGRRSL